MNSFRTRGLSNQPPYLNEQIQAIKIPETEKGGRWPDEIGDWLRNMLYRRFSASTMGCGACPLFHRARSRSGDLRSMMLDSNASGDLASGLWCGYNQRRAFPFQGSDFSATTQNEMRYACRFVGLRGLP
jgi:hypothetical protein